MQLRCSLQPFFKGPQWFSSESCATDRVVRLWDVPGSHLKTNVCSSLGRTEKLENAGPSRGTHSSSSLKSCVHKSSLWFL